MMVNEKKQIQLVSETAPADIHDRVTEAYYGRMGQQFMWETQNRIHWICRQVQGKNVLDVGCSQGIVPILLAREGLKIIGIDSSPKAIDEANHYLADEPEQVRRNVSFINTDFLSWDSDASKIGTVVMSEVLEHLTRPDSFLETAARVLAKKGRLIVTVPFGINDFIDHKHTFYLLSPLRLISKHFDVVDIEVLGKWLGIVADRRVGSNRGAEAFQPTTALMEKLESAFYQTERVLRDELSLTKKNQDEANQKYRGATEQVTALKERTTQEEAARLVAEQALQETTTQLKRTQSCLEEERTALQQHLAQLSQQAQASSTAAQEAEKHRLRLEAGLDEANQKYINATEQVTGLKQQATKEEAARKAAEQTLAHTSTLLEETQRFLQEERTALQQQFTQWSQQAQASAAAAQETEKYRLRLEAELAAVQSRLETANQKYRGATEQVAAQKADLAAVQSRLEETNQKYRGATEQVSALKQRTTEEEAARKAAEQALSSSAAAQKADLAAVQSRLEETNQKYRGATEQVAAHKADLAAVQSRLDETNQKYRGATEQVAAHKADLATVQSRLDETNQKYRGATEQVTALKQRTTEQEAARQAIEQALAQASTQLEQTQHSLQEERTQWSQQAQASIAAVEETEKHRLRLEAELDTVRGRLDEANQKYRSATEQVTALKQRTTEQEAARRTAEQGLQETQRRLQEERTALQQQLTQWSQQAQASIAVAQEAEKYRLRLEADLDKVRGRLDEANQKYGAATEQVTALKQRAAQEESTRRAAEQGLQETQRRLQEERTALQQQLAQWITEGQAKMVVVHEAEKKLIRLEAEMAAVQSRLDETNQKYRDATEQVTALKQRTTEEEAARKAAEQALASSIAAQKAELAAVQNRLDEANQKYRNATEQVTALKQRTTEEEAARRTAKQALQETQSSLQQERTALQQQLAQWSQQAQASGAAAQEADKQRLRLEAELATLQSRLDEASQKYRGATEQVTAMKQRTTEQEAARQTVEQALREAAGRLDQANSKYREATGKQIPELKNKLETKESKVREGQHALEQLRLQLRQDRKTLAETTRQLERTRQQTIAAKNQLVKTRETISFRFGYLLTHSFKSVNDFVGLPSALWTLRKEAIQRHKKKPFVPSPPKLLPSSEPSVIVSQPNELTDPVPQEPPLNGRMVSADATVTPITHSPIASVPISKLNIACIMDEFTFSSYQPESILHQLTPGNWRAELEGANPDLLFIESAWRGKDELWGNKVGHTSEELQGIVKWCGAKKIPTVFWCKEDPIHFETFLNTAKLFDYVFTTDIDCIHRYKAALGHGRVYLLPFACQPATNNPIETYQRKDAFCFAGAYYVRYPERTRDLGDFVMELPAFRPLEIYDRNYGKNDPNYQFPTEYQQYIVGTLPFDQIDKAYKGYRYAINLNSIKQSQSMFARRVFELLASNTTTISNFSRGLRLLFGDLVITTDSGSEIVRRLNKVADHEEHSRKLRLAALRKVMSEHTYGQRLAYVVSKVSGKAIEQSLPHIAVLSHAVSQIELEALQSNYQRQRYANTSLYVVMGDGITPPLSNDARVHLLNSEQAKDMVVDRLDKKAELVASMVAEDYYGPNYLEDIALATRYTQAELIGKAARYSWEGGGFQIKQPDEAYHRVQCLPARSAAIRCHLIAKENVLDWVQSLGIRQLQVDQGLAIDEFNYCEHGAAADPTLVREKVDDLPGLNTGISIDNLQETAERIAPESNRHDDCPKLTGQQLAGDFGKKPSDAITLAVDGQSWRVNSSLPDGTHEYLYATADHSLDELGFTNQLKVYFDVTPGLNIQLVIQFLDARKQKISHIINHANRNQEAVIPPGTDRIRLGLRFYAGGHAEIKGLVLGHRNLQPSKLICQAEHLLLTNHYPSYSDLYRNGFVHTRVRAYQARAVRCDVFRLRPDEALSYHEFEDVNVTTASQEVLHQMLSSGQYKSVLVHFLDQSMWDVLQHHVERIKVLVWVHGAEIQPLNRRDFDQQTEEQRAGAHRKSDERMEFWRALLRKVPTNLKLIFVSRYFAEEVMNDVGFRIPEEHYSIIHNPINTELFSYQEKSVEQRKKVLSIRPYASAKYANDLSVKTIQRLSQEPWFYDMEFRMIGDGPLFEETLAPLREFRNVYIEQRFLNQPEIAALHKEYGIFLCPTRMDAQGVSRDEAMASGLVPVTNAVTAIPEFVDENCGIVAPAEDAAKMAQGIATLHEHPERFAAISKAAAKRVRKQSDAQQIIRTELALVLDDSKK